MKKQIAVMLCLVMLISVVFSGCGGGTSIVGAWKGSVEVADMLNEMITGEDASMEEYIDFKDLKLDLTMTFKEDGTCSIVFDEASVEAMMEDLVDQMIPALTAMVEELSGMSLDALLELSGMTQEEWIDSMMAEFDAGMDMTEMNTEANYKVVGNKLYISESLEDPVGDNTSENPFTLEGNTLTIEAGEADDEYAFMFPLTLTKVG